MKIPRPWMFAYSIYFGLLSFFFALGNFEMHYLLIYSAWDVLLFALIFLGNIFYTFKYVTPEVRRAWKMIFPLVVLGFILDGIIDFKFGAAVNLHGSVSIISAWLFAFLILFPTFRAHYSIAFGKDATLATARPKGLVWLRKGLRIAVGILICLFMTVHFVSNFALLLLTGRVVPPSDSDFAVIAKQGEPIVQAIHNFRSKHGLLPLELSDAVPGYLTNQPLHGWYLDGPQLLHEGGIRESVAYQFTGHQGWMAFGEGISCHYLDIPGPTNNGPVLTGQALFKAKLAEYERRIQHRPADQGDPEGGREFCGDKIRFLGLADRQDLLRAECERDGQTFPDWWLPRMALAESFGLNSQAQRQFAAWVHQHPTFANYWYLSRYYRDKGDKTAALAALEQGSASLYVQYPEESQWSSPAYALDAAQFSYDNGKYALAVAMSKHCDPDDDGFEAASELKLMEFDSAISNAQQLVNTWKHYKWPPHLQESALLAAARAHDTNFVYRPEKYAKYYTNGLWVLFYPPRP